MSELTHKMEPLLESRSSHHLRIRMCDGGRFVISGVYALDKSIYGLDGGWSGTVVSADQISSSGGKFFKLGSGLDFYEKDISEIYDETTQEYIFKGK